MPSPRSPRGSEPESGVLYIVPTPIGNLGDLSPRARHILSEVDVVACEDTRVTRKLFGAVGIAVGSRLRSFHDHSSQRKVQTLIDELDAGGSLAVVSDAGTPGCSDPGFELVRAAVEAEITVVSVPGPSAAMAALVASGLPTDRALFAGFLPSKGPRRRRALEELAAEPATLVFYEAPGRLVALLEDVATVLGPRRVSASRELSKLHEEHIRGIVPQVLEILAGRDRIRGEIVLVVEGVSESAAPAHQLDPGRVIDLLLAEGVGARGIKTVVSALTGLPKSQVYALILEKGDSSR